MVQDDNDDNNNKKKKSNDEGKKTTQELLEDALGKESIPKGFGGLDGGCESDIIFGQYIK